jgi:hypothetical protein
MDLSFAQLLQENADIDRRQVEREKTKTLLAAIVSDAESEEETGEDERVVHAVMERVLGRESNEELKWVFSRIGGTLPPRGM